jgi:hypothetical protein
VEQIAIDLMNGTCNQQVAGIDFEFKGRAIPVSDDEGDSRGEGAARFDGDGTARAHEEGDEDEEEEEEDECQAPCNGRLYWSDGGSDKQI